MTQQSLRRHELRAMRYMFVEDESCSEESPDDASCSEDERSEDEEEEVITGRHGHYLTSSATQASSCRRQQNGLCPSSKAYGGDANFEPEHNGSQEYFYVACHSEKPLCNLKTVVNIFNPKNDYIIHKSYHEDENPRVDSSCSCESQGSFEENLEKGIEINNFLMNKEAIARAHDDDDFDIESFHGKLDGQSRDNYLQKNNLTIDDIGSHEYHDSFMNRLKSEQDKSWLKVEEEKISNPLDQGTQDASK
ncbi:hypothetical protein L7F22_023399 [Adiantum nelumboides]|nr:hypothetical protein [Adiantum nelumboides]